MQEPDGEALYLRLSTKPIDQAPFAALVREARRGAVRADVLAGGYWLREPDAGEDAVILATCGALVPEALRGGRAARRRRRAIAAGVLCLSSPDRLYRGLARCAARARSAT